VTSPFFLALPLTLLLVVFLLPNLKPYKTQIFDLEFYDIEPVSRKIYVDTNNDGTKEELVMYNYETFATIISFLSTGAISENWNLEGFWYDTPDFEIADLDQNGIPEIFSLTINKGDSILAGRIFLDKTENYSQYKYIARVKKINEVYDFSLQSLGINDITGDGFPDFVFSIGAGFTLQPRGVYAWDIKNDTVFKTPFAGMMYKFNSFPAFKDITNDNKSELFLTTTATDNYHSPVKYSDTSSYHVVLTENLNYLFPPVPVNDRSGISGTLPVKAGEDYKVFAWSILRRGEIERTVFRILDQKGNKLKEKVKDFINPRSKYIFYKGNIICTQVLNDETQVQLIDGDLTFNSLAKFDGNLDLFGLIHINNSKGSLILYNKFSDELLFYFIDDKKSAIIELPPGSLSLKGISIIDSKVNESVLKLETLSSDFTIKLEKNPWYLFRFLVYLLYYFIGVLFFVVIQKIFIYRNNRKRLSQEKLINYQLQAIMNQLNPHFTFNAINSIGGAILKGRNEEAYNYFAKLSGLIRKSMKNAFQPYKTLGEEIQFVREYLEIEAYRFEDRLRWEIFVDKNVDTTIIIPKMLIHIFAENAIKHGVFYKKGEGHIHINIAKEKDRTVISIIDNGPGLNKRNQTHSEEGDGIKILKNYLELFKEIQHTYIDYEIFTHDENSAQKGTKVIVTIKPGK
jgi:hypothetical protein